MLTELQRELDQGFPSFRGTRITATIPIREQVVNEIVSQKTTIARVEFLDSNVVRAEVYGISVKAKILRVEPELKIVLGVSFLVRMAIWPLKSRMPFVSMQGSEVTIDLVRAIAGKFPAYLPIVENLRLLALSSTRGLLIATIEFAVV